MRDVNGLQTSPLSRLLAVSIIACLTLAWPVQGQKQSPSTRVAAHGLAFCAD